MTVPEDIARRIDPLVGSATHVKDGGQKSVFRFGHGTDVWALKVVDLSDTERRLGETVDTVLARAAREVHLLRDIDSRHLPALGPIEPRIVRIDGRPYFAYSEEFIEGDSLSAMVASGSLPADDVSAVGCDMASALAALWAHRVVHRDVKPDNILRRSHDQSWVLLDPGYALDLADESLTRTGGIVGTEPYFSPEQLDVGNKRALDVRSDMYSLGIAMYEAAIGSHPYYQPGMSRAALYSAIRSTVPPDPTQAGCPPNLAQIIMRLVRKRPHLRYRSPETLLQDLQATSRRES